MKRICWIALTLALALICLAGCSAAQLEARDFVLYDANGNELGADKLDGFVEARDFTTYAAKDDQAYTSRGIRIGSTLEDVQKAYGSAIKLDDSVSDASGEDSFYCLEADNMQMFFHIPKASNTVSSISVIIYSEEAMAS